MPQACAEGFVRHYFAQFGLIFKTDLERRIFRVEGAARTPDQGVALPDRGELQEDERRDDQQDAHDDDFDVARHHDEGRVADERHGQRAARARNQHAVAGRGGYGNAHFATPTRQIPKFAKPGMPGEDIQVTLELKLIADVGLIGFPNVGKSTLISTISAAKPKIANYHFTTLVPTLGVVSVAEGASFVCADIPGLIEGASEGIGLGHDFLRHVERCRLLLHVVDVSGSECREPIEDFEKINEELAKFSPVLAERPQIVIGNKCDLATEEQIEAFRKYVEGKGLTFVPISAATMQGVKELPGLVYNRLKDIPPVPVFAPEYKKPEPKANDRAFEIKRMEAHVWSVEAPWLEYILAGSNVDDYESLQFFQRQLGESGILDALVEKGVQENDTILIGDYQFDYIF